jgi:hypothetical protein
MLLYLLIVKPFRFPSTLLFVSLSEAYMLSMTIIFSQYPQSPALRGSQLSILDYSAMIVTVLISIIFTTYTAYDSWKSLLGWKHARDHRLLNPYQVQPNFTQTGRLKVREAALKLVDIAENRAKIGDEFTDVVVGGPSALAEKDSIDDEPMEATTTVDFKPKKPLKDFSKEIAKKIVQKKLPKDPVNDFMMPESTAAVKDYRDQAKELRPTEDPSLTAEEAKKQQIKKPMI